MEGFQPVMTLHRQLLASLGPETLRQLKELPGEVVQRVPPIIKRPILASRISRIVQ